MRILKENVDINYNNTKNFFENRAKRFKEDNPYSVTMYQDKNIELVNKRNDKEIEKIFNELNLKEESKILDIACGIGRWADAFPEKIKEYCGIDFSEKLVKIAKKRNRKKNFDFLVGSADQVEFALKRNHKGKYNIILMIGILMYLNEQDVFSSLTQIEKRCTNRALVCIREPIGIKERLTLRDFFSEELKDNYNAIYRTRKELTEVFSDTLLCRGFHIKKEGFLFNEDGLNNRKETAQYFYILERN